MDEREEYEEVLIWHPYPEDPPIREGGFLCQYYNGKIVFGRYQDEAFTLHDESITWWAERPEGRV